VRPDTPVRQTSTCHAANSMSRHNRDCNVVFLARDALVRMNRQSSRNCHDLRPSVYLSVWDGRALWWYTVHVSADFSLYGWIYNVFSGHLDIKACLYLTSHPSFSRRDMHVQAVIYQERFEDDLKIECYWVVFEVICRGGLNYSFLFFFQRTVK